MVAIPGAGPAAAPTTAAATGARPETPRVPSKAAGAPKPQPETMIRKRNVIARD